MALRCRVFLCCAEMHSLHGVLKAASLGSIGTIGVGSIETDRSRRRSAVALGNQRARGTRTACEGAHQQAGWRQAMRTSTVIILAVAISMGGSAAYLTRNWLKDHTAAAVQPAGTIVVAAESLAYGTAMTPDNVVEIPWFSNTLPEGAFAVKDDLLN